MKNVLIILGLLCCFNFGFAQSVDAVADKVLKELQMLSTRWQSVKDKKSADVSIQKSMLHVRQLQQYAKELKTYPRPNRNKRQKIYDKRKKKVEKISLEMANTLTLLSKDAALMAYFSKKLRTLTPELSKSQAVFDSYFKPDNAKVPEPKKIKR